MGYGEAMSLPISVFWELIRNIDRIKAEDDIRMLRLLSNVVGGNPSELHEMLSEERGEIASSEDETGFDRSSVNRLKAILGKR